MALSDDEARQKAEELHALAGLATAAAHGIITRPAWTRVLPVKRFLDEVKVFEQRFKKELGD